ncbi:ABC transporter permease [Ancylobacter amanitiformis]|uniref:Spermidine/putrescine transport system permease protein n=1 Tax=Ancylobacter amanitiformis TaxID=217069 RepID=A0ABU0LT34_9HYPH|nr:ABC transporter permease [Ancylobacter amanitiformis]MDQ0511866.1 spermidine/putrescine transport system permease protein [Ancylobacter amanitiformis]
MSTTSSSHRSARPRRRGIVRDLLWHGLNLGLPLLFVVLPILSFVLVSFWTLTNGQIVHTLTLANYRAFFTEGSYLQVYLGTVLLSAQVTLINVVLAIAIAVFIFRRTPRVRFLILMSFMLPLFMSYIIKIYSIRSILGQRGLLNEGLLALGLIDQPIEVLLFSRTAIFIALAVLYLPYAILPIYLALDRIPANYLAASADLGATPLQALRDIVLPLGRPGIAAGAVFTFILTFGDFVTPQMVGGTQGFTFGRIVFSQFGLALNWPLGSALAVILLATTLLAVALAGLTLRREHVR